MSNAYRFKRFLSKATTLAAIACGALAALATPHADPDDAVYNEGEKYVKIGDRIQVQHPRTDPDGGEQTDKIIFRISE